MQAGGGYQELSTLSVLFTDLVDSTALRTRLGEDAADVMRRTHDAVVCDAVTGHGGRVVKGLGDGFMATFSSAARAVRAAVEIQQQLDHLRHREPETALVVRIGISLGDVTIEDGDVFGTPVIEAARLCAAAHGDQILATSVVVALARGEHASTPVGDLELKGLAAPIPTVEIGWERATVTTRIPLPAGLAVRDGTFPFHGRDEPMAELASAWKRARHDSTKSCVLVAGEPGMGKTRLAAEFARAAHDEGALVLFGRCDEDFGAAYQPFLEALGHHVAHATDDDRGAFGAHPDELSRLVPELRSRYPDLGAPDTSGDAEVDQYRLFRAVDSWLGAAASTAGLVLVLDDLHWAAKPTLLMLRHVLDSGTRASLLVVVTYRDTDLDRTHPLAALLADLRRVPGVERLPLSGLDRAGVEGIMYAVNQHELDDAGSRLAAAVHAETEGNPFFVGEVLRHLAETGALVHDGTQWVPATSVETMSIPDGIREVVGRRLSRLSDAANDVLAWSAVVGRELRLDVLAIVAGGDDRVLDALDEAVDARLVDEVGAGRWRFAHALVRATLLAELRTTRKVRMHLAVGEAYEAVAPTDVVALAQHFAEAAPLGVGAKAVTCLLAAGQAALDELAFDQAAALHEQALEIIDDVALDAPDLRADAACGRAIALRWSGADSREAILTASDLAADLGDGHRMARVLLETHRGFVASVFVVDEALVARYERCLDLLPPDDSRERVMITAALSLELTYSADIERFVRLAGTALEAARRIGDPDALAAALFARAVEGSLPDRIGAFDETLRELEVLVDHAPSVTRARIAITFAGHAGWTGARRPFEAALAIVDSLPDGVEPATRWQASAVRAGFELRYGDLAAAERHANALLDEASETGELDAMLWHINLLAFTRRQQGRHDDAVALLEPVLSPDDDRLSVATGCLLALMLCEAGRPAEARELVPRCFAAARVLLRDSSWLPNLGALAVAASELGARDEAAWLLEQLEPFMEFWSTWSAYGPVAPVATIVGRLRATLDDGPGAEEAFDHAVGHCRETGARFFLADALLHQGLARAAHGEHDLATPLLTEALDLARDGGYTYLERRAESGLSPP